MSDTKQGKRGGESTTREQRSAAALRANLRRRKVQGAAEASCEACEPSPPAPVRTPSDEP